MVKLHAFLISLLQYCCDSEVMTPRDRDISKLKVGLQNNLIEENLNLNDTTSTMKVLYQTHHWTQDSKLHKNSSYCYWKVKTE